MFEKKSTNNSTNPMLTSQVKFRCWPISSLEPCHTRYHMNFRVHQRRFGSSQLRPASAGMDVEAVHIATSPILN